MPADGHGTLEHCRLSRIDHTSHVIATAHAMAMFAPFVVVLMAAGAPLHMAIIPFFGVTGICGGLTYYSMAPGVILYGSGYVEHHEWFRLGFIVSSFNLAVWMIGGSLWWKILGYW